MSSFMRTYRNPRGAFDPCPPLPVKFYSTPPQLFVGFQPSGLEQFPPAEALRKGTLWHIFYDFYENPYETIENWK